VPGTELSGADRRREMIARSGRGRGQTGMFVLPTQRRPQLRRCLSYRRRVYAGAEGSATRGARVCATVGQAFLLVHMDHRVRTSPRRFSGVPRNGEVNRKEGRRLAKACRRPSRSVLVLQRRRLPRPLGSARPGCVTPSPQAYPADPQREYPLVMGDYAQRPGRAAGGMA